LFARFEHFCPFLPFTQILRFANRASGIAHFFGLSGPRYFCHFVVLLILPRGAFAARALANNTVIKAGVRERCKVLTKSRSEHFMILLVMLFSQANAQLRLNVILADPSAKLANNTVIKVNQHINVLFCFLFMGKPFNPSLTRLVHPFPYLDIIWACCK